MFNPERLLGQLLKSGLGGGRRRGRGGSLLGGLSTGTKAQLGMGLLGVAIAAYEHYQKQGHASIAAPASPEPLPPPSPLTQPIPNIGSRPQLLATEAPPQQSRDASLLVRAMVAAAAADGVIDDEEKALMLKRATDAGFDAETKRFLEQELTEPKSLAVIVAASRPEIATDVYAASCAAISADTDSERIYLDTLAKRLGIEADARAEIHRQLDLA